MGRQSVEGRPAAVEAGRSLVVTVLGAVAAFVVGFLVYEVVPFYYYYFDLKNHMQREITFAAVETDEEIRRSLMAVVRRHGIACGERDLQITREGDTMGISLHYSEPLGFSFFGTGVTLHTFEFDAAAQGSFK